MRGGGRASRTGELGWSGEHVLETAATQGRPAGCEAGRCAQVILFGLPPRTLQGEGDRVRVNSNSNLINPRPYRASTTQTKESSRAARAAEAVSVMNVYKRLLRTIPSC